MAQHDTVPCAKHKKGHNINALAYIVYMPKATNSLT